MKTIKIRVGFICSVKGKKTNILTNVSKLYELMNNERMTINIIKEIRKLTQEIGKLGDSEEDEEKKKNKKNRVTHLKNKLFAMQPMCMASLDGSRVTKSKARPSGLCMHDFDHLEMDVHELYNNKVKPLIDELNIVMAYITPSGEGLRLINILPRGMTIKQCQKMVAEKLGLQYDKQISDLSRLSFISTAKDLLYLDQERFFNHTITQDEQNEILELIRNENGAEDASSEKAITDVAVSNAAVAEDTVAMDSIDPSVSAVSSIMDFKPLHDTGELMYKGFIPWSAIVKEIIKRCFGGGRIIEGQREVACNKIAWYISPLCDQNFDLVYSIVRETFENLGLDDEEIRHAVSSAVRAVGAYTKNATPMVNQIIHDVTIQYGLEETFELPKMPDDVPEFFHRLRALFPEQVRDAASISALSALGYQATGVRFRYLDNSMQSLSFVNIVGAPPASNKSYVKHIDKILLKGEIEKRRKMLKVEEEERLHRNEVDGTGEKKTYKKYNFRILAQNSTDAVIYKRLGEGDTKHKMLLTDEIKSLLKGGTTFGETPTILTHAFDNSRVSKDTAGDQSANVDVDVYVNTIVCGTTRWVRKFLGDGEDGLATRALLVLLGDNLDEDVPFYKEPTAEDIEYFNGIIDRLIAEGADTESQTIQYAFPLLKKFFTDKLNAQRAEYALTRDAIWRRLGFRAHVMGFRAAVVAWLVSGKPIGMDAMDYNDVSDDIRKILNFGAWVTEYVQTAQYYFLHDSFSNALAETDYRTSAHKRPTASILDQLPQVFTLNDVNTARRSLGLSDHSNPSQLVTRWIGYGFAASTGKTGQFRKTSAA